MNIKIGEKKFNVDVVDDQEDMKRGLRGVNYLPENEGMLFVFDSDDERDFWMPEDTFIDLDICFIDDDMNIVQVFHAKAGDLNHYKYDAKYVLEVNSNSGINVGDEVDFEDEDDEDKDYSSKMLLLFPDGSVQQVIEQGQRIISRKETKIIIKKAKLAYKSRRNKTLYDKLCIQLGKYIFKVLDKQDGNEAQFVSLEKK